MCMSSYKGKMKHQIQSLISTVHESILGMSGFIPPDKQNLEYEYNKKYSKYDAVIAKVKSVLENELKNDAIKIIKFEARIKLFESFYEKTISHQISSNYFENIEDLAGVRLVCLYYSDLDKIADIIKKYFFVRSMKERTFDKRVDDTGYQSNHYVVRIPDKLVTKTEEFLEPEISKTDCEIQVRTALMHAWSSVSHGIFYKKKLSLDKMYQYEMYAISSLFFFADQRFDSYSKLIAKEETKETAPTIVLQQSLTPISLKEYLTKKFPDRDISNSGSIYELSKQLMNLNYKTLQDLDNIVIKTWSILPVYENENPMSFNLGAKRDAVGAIRICVAIGDPQNKNSKSFYVKDILKYRRMIEG